jgi:hypothetical protein
MVINRIKFPANVPVTLDRSDLAQYTEQLLPEFSKHPLTGQRMSDHRPVLQWLGDKVLEDRPFWCEVDGVPPPKRIRAKGAVPPAGHEWAGTNREDAIEGEHHEITDLD